MTGLWPDYPARGGRRTQAEVLLAMLRQARTKGEAIRLPEIMAAGIAQHGARLHELRRRGFVIENQTQRAPGGRVFSQYYLKFDPEQDKPEPSRSACEQAAL